MGLQVKARSTSTPPGPEGKTIGAARAILPSRPVMKMPLVIASFHTGLTSIVVCSVSSDGLRLEMDRFGADPELLRTRAEALEHQAGRVKALGATLESIVGKAFDAVGGNERDATAEEFWRQWHPGARNLLSALDATQKLYDGTYQGVVSMATGLGQMEESNVEAAGKLRSGSAGGTSHRA
jgi:hypothetical protein